MRKQKDTGIALVPQEYVESKILLIRDKKVMLDKDLAELYGVETRALNQAVKRNNDRFPEDFMFQLTKTEAILLVSQNVIPSKRSFGGSLPYVFTEHGTLMVANIIKSTTAVKVSIVIVRAFVKLREMMLSHKDLQNKIEAMERKHDKHDQHFQVVFKAIKEMLNTPVNKKGKIGFRSNKAK